MLIFWGPELITFYNDAFRPSLGDNGKHPSSLGQKGEQSWAESWPVIGPMIYDIMAGGEAVWFEDQKLPLYRDGQLGYAYWTYSFSPLTGDDDEVNGILVTCSETTQAVEARNQAEEAQQQVLAFFEQSPVGIAIISADKLTYRMANPFYGYLVGREPDQIVGKSLLEALPELAGQGFDGLLEEVIQTGIPFIAKEVAINLVRNGQLETIYVDLTYQPRREADQRISGILVVATDVTQQVLSRQKVEDSETKLRSLIAGAPAGIGLFVGQDLIIEHPNQTFIDIVGKGAGIVGLPLREAMPELLTEGQPFLNILDEVYTTGVPFISPASLVRIVQNGVLNDNYYNISYTPIYNAEGAVYAILDIAIDVTAEVKARQQLQETQLSLREAIELAQLGTWSIEVATQGLLFSDRLIEWFGYDPNGQAYQAVIPILSVADQARVDRSIAWALNPASDGVYDEIYTVIHPKTGHKRILHARGQTVFNAGGNAIRLNGTAQDITLQREQQLALEQQIQLRTEELAAANEELAATNEELEASNEEYSALNEELEESNSLLTRSNDDLQKFAYIASHDLQEPLRKIQQFGDLLRSRFTDSASDQQIYLERMQSAASRMSSLIRDLLDFSLVSNQREVNQPVPLTEVINRALTTLELVIEESGATITVEPLPTIMGDASQLDQLFQNLLSNALKFRQPGQLPRIHLTSRLIEAAGLPPSVKPTRIAPVYHQLDVADNGVGFDEKYLDRIFQVFQRLYGRNEYAGTGIGLAICEKVVANHGGAITASSQPGQGATFSVFFPTE